LSLMEISEVGRDGTYLKPLPVTPVTITLMMRRSSRLLRRYKINLQTNKPQKISK